MAIFMQLLLRSLETGSVYALAALGIIIIYRTSNITHFAQGAMGMFNTFAVTFFFLYGRMPLWMAVLMGVGTAFVMGVLVDLIIIRRAKRIAPISKQIITLGLIMVILGLASTVFGVDPLPLPKLIQGGEFDVLGATISYNAVFNIVFGLALMSLFFYILQRTKWGLAVRTTASNELTARLMGVPTKTVTMVAWALAGVLGVLSGVMIAPATKVDLNVLDAVQINALIACVLGGFQSFYGPVIGAYIIAIAKNMIVFYGQPIGLDVWGEQLVLLSILVFIIFRPNGIIGKKIVKKV